MHNVLNHHFSDAKAWLAVENVLSDAVFVEVQKTCQITDVKGRKMGSVRLELRMVEKMDVYKYLTKFEPIRAMVTDRGSGLMEKNWY
jgi:hypothetical protein